MLKEKTASEAMSSGSSGSSSLLAEMFQVGLYKRNQGKIARRVTLGALAASAAVAGFRLYEYLNGYLFGSEMGEEKAMWIALGSGAGLFLVATWICFRLVNYPRFADFLIAVEAEMNKVSWPSKGVLARSSLVVIICLFAFAFAMAAFDIIWVGVFQSTGVMQF